MAYFTRHEQCPRCRSEGNDRSANNLGVYSDGSAYCFKCGYYIPSKNSLDRIKKTEEIPKQGITIPEDSECTLPKLARDYLDTYEINLHDRASNCILWSESWSRIIFPYFTNDRIRYENRRRSNSRQGRRFVQRQAGRAIQESSSAIQYST